MKKLITLLTIIMLAAPVFGQLDLVKRNITALNEVTVRDTTIINLIKKHGGSAGEFPYTQTLENSLLWTKPLNNYFQIKDSEDGQIYFSSSTGYSNILLTTGSSNSMSAQSDINMNRGDIMLISRANGGNSMQLNFTDKGAAYNYHQTVQNPFWLTDKSYVDSVSMINSGIISATVTLTSAQLINNTPVEIVPAQATGKMAVPLNVVLKYNHGTTNYTSNEFGIGLLYGTTPAYSVFTQSISSFLMSTASKIAVCDLGFGGDESIITNAALNVKNDTADTAAGDGTLTVIVSYMVIDI